MAVAAVLALIVALMPPALAEGGEGATPPTITGTVLAPTGSSGVAAARVELTPVGDPYFAHVLLAREDGVFGGTIPPGVYEAEALAPASNPDHYAASVTQTVTIPESGALSVDLRLRLANVVALVTRRGAPATDAQVTAQNIGTGESIVSRTADDGNVSLRLADGTWQLMAFPESDELLFEATEDVTVSNGQVVGDVPALALREPTVTGTIAGPDGQALTVAPDLSLWSDGSMAGASARALADGRYGAVLQDGSWTITARPGRGSDRTWARGVHDVTVAGTMTGRDFRLSAGTLVGRVTRPASGTTPAGPVEGAFVSAFGSDPQASSYDEDESDPDGYYALALPSTAATAFLEVEPPPGELTVASAVTEPFDISAPPVTRDVELPETNMRGVLVAPDGQTPVRGGSVQALTSGGDYVDRGHATTDEQGRWALRLPAGSYSLRGEPPFYDASGHRPGLLAVEVPTSGVLADQRIALTRPTVVGEVRSSDGSPVSFAGLRVVDVDNRSLVQLDYNDRPDFGGTFSLSLPAGTYRLVASPPIDYYDFSATSAETRAESTVTIAAGEIDRRVDLVFGPEGAKPWNVERLDVATGGGMPGEGMTSEAALSRDGSAAAFVSERTGLVAGVEGQQVYLRDLEARTTELVSASSAGDPATAGTGLRQAEPDVSGDGRFIVFTSDAENLANGATGSQVYLRDRITDRTLLVSAKNGAPGSGTSDHAAISGDGSLVAFTSYADDLDTDDGNPYTRQVFLARIGVDGLGEPVVTELAQVTSFTDGAGAPELSADGSALAFYARGEGGWSLHVRATEGLLTAEPSTSGAVALVDTTTGWLDDAPSVSADGSRVGFVRYGVDGDGIRTDGVPATWTATGSQDLATFADAPALSSSVDRVELDSAGTSAYFTSQWPENNNGSQVFAQPLAGGPTELVSMGPNADGVLGGGAQLEDVAGSGDRVAFTATGEGVLADTNMTDGSSGLFLATRRTDTELPAWADPSTALRARTTGATLVELEWDAAQDASGIRAYRVLRNGQQITETTSIDTDAVVSGLEPATEYAFSVLAVDSFGNVSDPGLALPVTTAAAGGASGSAALFATAGPAGVVDLSWDIAEAGVAYRVLRATGDGAFASVADVAAGITTYRDSGLDAETDYRYRIDRIELSGAEAPHSRVTEVRTQPLAPLTSVDWSGSLLPGGALPYAGTVSVTARGEPGRTAVAHLGVQSWHDATGALLDAPAARELDVPLSESSQTPGSYASTYSLPDGVAQLDSLSVTLSDGTGHSVSRASSRALPVPVAGALDVDIADQDEVAGGRLDVFSDTTSLGGRSLADHRTQSYSDLRPATYAIRLTDASGRILVDERVAVAAGRKAVKTVQPKQFVALDLTVEDPDGVPVPHRPVSVYDGETYLQSGYADGGGAASFTGLPDVDQLRIVVQGSWPADRFVRPALDTTVDVVPGRNTKQVRFEAIPSGVVSGTVSLLGGGSPEGGSVTLTQTDPHRSSRVQLGADGRYSLPMAAESPAQLHVSAWGSRSAVVSDVVVDPGGTVVRDVQLARPLEYTVNAELWVSYPDQDEHLVSLGGWREVVHYDDLRIEGAAYARLTDSPNVTVRAYPGEAIRFCGGGSEAGLGAGCGPEVTLPADNTAPVKVELHLGQPQRIQGTVVDGAGVGLTSWSAWLTDESGRVLPGGSAWSYSTAQLSMTPAQTGELTLHGSAYRIVDGRSESLRGSQSITVGSGGITDVTLVLQPMDAAFRGDGNGISSLRPTVLAGGVAAFRTSFRNNGSSVVEDAVVRLDLPAGTTVAPNGVLLDGRVIEVAPGGSLEVPVGDLDPGESGVVLHHVVLDSDVPPGEAISTTATIVSGESTTLLGSARTVVGSVTLRGPSSTNESTVVLRGNAPAGTLVEVYDGDGRIGSAEATAGGMWSARVTLPDRGVKATHSLVARVQQEGVALSSDRLEVLVDRDRVVVTEMSIRQSESSVQTWDPRQGVARFPLVWVPGRPFLIDVTFSDPSRVANVVAFVGQQSGVATLKDGVHSAEVMGDGSGDIAVEFDVVDAPMTFSTTVPTEAEVRNRMPLWATDFEAVGTPVTNDDGSITSRASLPGLDADLTSTVDVREVGSKTISDEDYAQMQQSGIPVFGATRSFSTDPETGVLTMTETAYLPRSALPAGEVTPAGVGSLRLRGAPKMSRLTFGKVVDAIESTTKHELGHKDFGSEELKDFAESAKETADEGGSKFDDVGEMYDRLDGLPPADQEALRQQADDLMQTATNAELLGAASQLGFLFAAPTGPLGELGMLAVEEGLSKAIDADFERKKAKVDRAIDAAKARQKFKDELDAFDKELNDINTDLADICKGVKQLWIDFKMPPPDPDCNPDPPGGGRQRTPGAGAAVIVDPSGYVYEGVASSRLAGVTATVLSGPSADGPWTPWDAEWYGQSNPLVTGVDGRYAWDVPLGWWKVEYSKPGYETGYSEPLEVLPPRFDVNEGLLSLAAPVVAAVARDGGDVVIGFDRWMKVAALGADMVTVTGADGGVVAGTLAPVGAETAPGTGTLLARSFRWTPLSALASGAYDVRISGAAVSDADRIVGDDVVRSITVPPSSGGGGSDGGGAGGGTGSGDPAPDGSPSAAPTPTASPTASPAPAPGSTTAGQLVPLAEPKRALDTRTGTDPVRRTGLVTLDLSGILPAGTQAALLNVTVTGADRNGHVSAWAHGEPDPGTSNVNVVAGETQANLVMTRVSADRKVTLSVVGSPMHLIVDVVGSYGGTVPSASLRRSAQLAVASDGVVATTPARVLDSRIGLGTVARAKTGPVTLRLPDSVPTGARAVLLNVTATAASKAGHVTAYPGGTAKPATSNVNVVPGRTQANLVLVGIGANRTVTLDVHAGPMHLLADLVGYQLGERPAAAPERVLDSRIGLGTSPFAKQGPVQLRLPDSVPADAAVVWLNVTVTGASAPGHVTAYAAGSPKPATSNVNVKRGQTQANLVAVPIGTNRSVVLDVHGGGMHLIADLVGWQPAG